MDRVVLADPQNRPSARAPLLWATSAALPWGALVVAQVSWWLADPSPHWTHVLAAVGTVLGIVLFVGIAPVWRYRVHRWDIDARAVYTRTGWLVQERRIAPISRVQTVDTQRGPLDRLFGLATVTVTTASSAGAVRIVALDAATAERVVAQLTDIAALGEQDAT
ncbi:PH domain-containing protein [Mycolicibacterium litorale]|uniref:PH domain-containing protein n=1 Tax=Mycolicibacterium litorale TaxID=758802 RepID=UPI003CF78747